MHASSPISRSFMLIASAQSLWSWKTAYSQFQGIRVWISLYVCVCSVAQLCLTLCDTMDSSFPGTSVWASPGKHTGVGCHFLHQWIILSQGSNPHLLQLLLWQVDIFMGPIFCLSQGGTQSNKHQHISSKITWIVQAS